MPRKPLTELANNPNLISGIYNYCDRWCERCPLTSRCLVYASESELSENSEIENNDIRNAEFWHTLTDALTEVRALIPVWTKDTLDLNEPAATQAVPRQTPAVDNHPLTKAGKQYANAASNWFREIDHAINISDWKPQPFEDAREVIHRYQYQIPIKTIRALSARNEDDSEDNGFPKDSDGSAKVALIGIDRSMAAWRRLQLSLSDPSIVPLILQLESLRIKLEESFPEARDFIRPGFDQIAAA